MRALVWRKRAEALWELYRGRVWLGEVWRDIRGLWHPVFGEAGNDDPRRFESLDRARCAVAAQARFFEEDHR